MRHLIRVIGAVVFLVVASAIFAAEPLPSVPPTPASEALKTFQIHPGLRIELVASEPMVQSPVGICFDEEGRLFVVEMRGYPDRRDDRLGRITVLESSKSDGHYDRSRVLADHLPWPTSAICYNGGLFVTASPDLLWIDAAGQAKPVFTGFGIKTMPLNVQGLVNGLNWGVDLGIHGATSHNGGSVVRPDSNSPPLELRGRDFAFNPATLDLSAEDGGGQHGMGFDSFARKFFCANSNPIETVAFDSRYAARQPSVAFPASRIDIYSSGMDVWRRSPEESWRVLRTKLRISGAVAGPIEGGGRASGYFTGVSGLAMYTGDALAAEFADNAFIGEVANNLVHRIVIHEDRTGLVASRADDEVSTEFVASTDIWFRPVQLANGPDGALYIVDMYRQVIEHPWSLPDEIKDRLNLHAGEEMGRIWRVVPEEFTPRPLPHLSQATTPELVALLEHSNGWHRDTAARLLFQRQDPAAPPVLEQLAAQSKSAVGRFCALNALAALKGLPPQILLAALHDADAHVRKQAVLLAEPTLRNADMPATIWNALGELADDDPSMPVRYQLAFSLGESQRPDRFALLAKLARKDGGDRAMRLAILSSASGGEAQLFETVAQQATPASFASSREFFDSLAMLIGVRGRPAEVGVIADQIKHWLAEGHDGMAFSLGSALRQAAPKTRDDPAKFPVDWAPLIRKAQAQLSSGHASSADRLNAIGFVGTLNPKDALDWLLPLLADVEPAEVQQVTVAAMDRMSDARIAPELIQRLKSFTPAVRSAAIAALLKWPERATQMLEAIKAGAMHANDVSSVQAAALRNHADPKVRALARATLAQGNSAIADLIKQFQPALELTGSADHGRKIYLERCSSCHRLGGQGFAVGPDLTTIRNAGKAKALTNIIDPNREVAPNYVAYVVETRAGESLVGIVIETPGGIIVRQPFGRETPLQRSDIKRLVSQKISLMPEGLQQGMSNADFADLLEYVFTAPAK